MTQAQTAQQQQESQTTLVADNFSRLILNSENQLRVFGETLVRTSDPAAITDEQLAGLVRSSSAFTQVGLYDSRGQRLAAAARLGPQMMPDSITATVELEQVQAGRTVYTDPPALTARSIPLSPAEIPHFRIALPVQVSFNERMVLIGDMNMDQLWTLTTQLEQATGAQIFVLTGEGVLISAAKTQTLIDQPAFTQLPLFQETTSVATYQNTLGDEVVGIRDTIDPPGWTLLVERSSREIYGVIQTMALSLLAVILVALPVVMGIGWFAGRQIAQPIQQLHQNVEHFTRNPASYAPVVPIVDGMVVMPLVGEFTESRAQEITMHLLEAIQREQARVVLIDITGVAVVDSAVAQALINTHNAARLLGTQVILAGIRPETAQTLVDLGLDLGTLCTVASLKHAFILGISYLPQSQHGLARR